MPTVDLNYQEVVEDIAGNANGIDVMAEQLNAIDGISGAVDGLDYALILATGNYADPANPAKTEIQAVLDDFISGNDTDGDGFSDAVETLAETDAADAASKPQDFDADGFADAVDVDDDGDGDGYADRAEDAMGTDSLNAGSEPSKLVRSLMLQATFGPAEKEESDLLRMGINGWVDYQLNLPSAYDDNNDSHLSYLQRMMQLSKQIEPDKAIWFPSIYEFTTDGGPVFKGPYRKLKDIFFEHAFHADDQLRQRVAYALS